MKVLSPFHVVTTPSNAEAEVSTAVRRRVEK
jgi:hypothetical protein